METLGRLPLEFVENCGQWPSPTRFGARRGHEVVAFENEAIVLGLQIAEMGRVAKIALHFEGASGDAVLRGRDPLPGTHNYLYGADPAAWATEVPTFATLEYEALYEGIDVRVYEAASFIEYDVVCDSGRRLPRFSVSCAGADSLSVDQNGRLLAKTGDYELVQDRPIAWYVQPDGSRRPVACEYELRGANRFGLKVAETLDLPLVVDPKVSFRVLLWSTFIGGSGDDIAWDVAVAQYGQSMGQVFVVGETTSSNFPTTTGAYDTTYNGTTGDRDVFVVRLNAQASNRVYSTFVGSGCDEVGYAIDLADDGNGDHTVAAFTGYCTGNTSGVTCRYPTAGQAFDVNWLKGAGQTDAFVSILDPTGTTLLYSSYLGSDENEESRAIAVVPNPSTGGIEVVIGGWTQGGNGIVFPAVVNPGPGTPYQGTFQGPNPSGTDAFLAHFTTATGGTPTLRYSTYLGGSVGDERVLDLQVNPDTNLTSVEVVAVGATTSTNYPVRGTPLQGSYQGGSHDGFVSRLLMAGGGNSDLQQSTFLGGSEEDRCWGVVLHGTSTPTQLVTVGGSTNSANFPTAGSPPPWDTTHNGGFDGFVTRLDNSLSTAPWSTFLGGSEDDEVHDIAIVPGTTATPVTVCGSTFSSDTSTIPFPVYPTNPPPSNNRAYDITYNGNGDVFVTRISQTGGLGCSTYLGADAGEIGWGIAPDGRDEVIVVGQTGSSAFPTTSGVVQTTYGGGTLDGFASKFRIGQAFPAGGL